MADYDWVSLRDFSTIIDVRTPAEYAEDHLPQAISLPVLDDAQRHEVGLLYKRDRFAGRRLGAGLIASSIGGMLAGPLRDRPADWRPLVYCWRGGQRSNSLVHVLREIGWDATAVPGGYRFYRREVVAYLEDEPARFDWRVLCGPTGSGKTDLLAELQRQRVQVLDLEGLANHRGSVFGGMGEQPTQKRFEGAIAQALRQLDPRRPVFVESESRRIGRVSVPSQLLASMHASVPVIIDATLDDRAEYTASVYTDFGDPARFATEVDRLARYLGSDEVARCKDLHSQGRHVEVARSLLESHYDGKYANSLGKHYDIAAGIRVGLVPHDQESLRQAAAQLAARCEAVDAGKTAALR